MGVAVGGTGVGGKVGSGKVGFGVGVGAEPHALTNTTTTSVSATRESTRRICILNLLIFCRHGIVLRRDK
jgi:hypothetical protein